MNGLISGSHRTENQSWEGGDSATGKRKTRVHRRAPEFYPPAAETTNLLGACWWGALSGTLLVYEEESPLESEAEGAQQKKLLLPGKKTGSRGEDRDRSQRRKKDEITTQPKPLGGLGYRANEPASDIKIESSLYSEKNSLRSLPTPSKTIRGCSVGEVTRKAESRAQKKGGRPEQGVL